MRKIVFFCVFLLGAINLIAQSNPRESVAIVRPVYQPSSVSFLTNFSKSLERNGYKNASEIVKGYTEGRFGSGFVYADKSSGKSYIVTNRHVVAQAASATIEFHLSEKEIIKYEDCEIVAVDELMDLALIELPSEAKTIQSMNIQILTPDEGSEVFTAGFPGLGQDASWQLGQGIISNKSVYNNLLTGSDSIGVIQHTAQIDAGSSGGPLMVRNANGNFDIIGVNTWKVEGRQNVNLAISGQSLDSFIKELSHKDLTPTLSSLESQARDFTEALKGNYKDILPYISSEYVSNVSVGDFYDLLNAISSDARKEVISRFNDGRPIDGVRIALADAIAMKYKKENFTFSATEEIEDSQSKKVLLTTPSLQETATDWVFEHGDWRLQHLSSLKLNNLEKGGVATHYGYKNLFKIGIDFPLSSDVEGMQYKLSFDRTYRTFLVWGVGLGMGKKTFLEEDLSSSFDPNTGQFSVINEKKKSYFTSDLSLGLQLPVKVSSMYIVPNAKGLFGMDFGEDTGGMNYGFILGLDVAYKLSHKTYLHTGLNFKRRFIISQDYDSNINGVDSKFPDYSSIGFHVGITW